MIRRIKFYTVYAISVLSQIAFAQSNPEFPPTAASSRPASQCVAVIDTGIDYRHSVFKGSIFQNPGETIESRSNAVDLDNNGHPGDLHGWDFVDNDPYPYDEDIPLLYYPAVQHLTGLHPKDVEAKDRSDVEWQISQDDFVMWHVPDSQTGHGSHVAGIVLKHSPETCIVPIRVDWDWEQISEAVDYVAKLGVKIVNMSFGGFQDSMGKNTAKKAQKLQETLQNHPEMMFVMISHNQGIDLDDSQQLMFPASVNIPNKIVVGALDEAGNLADLSNYSSDQIDLYAPGMDIESAEAGGGLLKMSGTSMAAPMIAGLLAKILDEYRISDVHSAKCQLLQLAATKELESKTKRRFRAQVIVSDLFNQKSLFFPDFTCSTGPNVQQN